jgi:hypothetical protein
MGARFSAVVACLIGIVATADLPARDGACRVPAVNKRGFRPYAVVPYMVDAAPGGIPFPSDRVACVDRAFEAWTRANAATGLHVQFVRGPGGIVVRFDRPDGLVLPRGKGGAWSDPVRAADGYLEQANVWLSSDARLLDSCDGVTKVTLHELGHLHGLDDAGVYRGPSVMNRAARRDDAGGRIPFTPTPCDAQQARVASVSSGLLAHADPRR